jgi:hypothetical protein
MMAAQPPVVRAAATVRPAATAPSPTANPCRSPGRHSVEFRLVREEAATLYRVTVPADSVLVHGNRLGGVKTSQRLTEITLEETLRGSVFIGSPDTVVGKLKDLQRDIGLSGMQLETNCAGLADHAAEREAIRLLAREVKSAFR